jgi:glycosyltransferase involved in cell wall biosynthesis
VTSTPGVTIVMPVYNGERFIARAIQSALASTFKDFELLVIDDGSTDGSVAEAHRAAAGDDRMRVITVPHGGVAAARNAGLHSARGEFLANLDSDDEMLPHRLARQFAYLGAHPECVVVSCRSVVIDSDGKPIGIVGRYFTHEDIDASLLDGNGGALGNDSAMFRVDALRAIGGYEQHLNATGEDHDISLRLAEHGRVACLPDVLNRYRVHQSNVSLGAGSSERRLPVTLETLRRAFERRGLTTRVPEKRPSPPMSRSERLRDAALVDHFRGNRAGAAWRAMAAVALRPTDPAALSAFRIAVL